MKKVITYIITIIAISSLLRGNQANSQQQTSYLENVKTLNSLISYQEYQKAADFLEVLSIDSENEQIQEHGIALSRTIDIAPISDSAPISSIILALTPYTLPLLYGITVPKKYIPKIWATSALIFLEAAFLATTRSVIAEWSINSKLISRYLKTAPKEIILNIQKKKWTIFTLYTLFHTLKHKQDDPGVLSFFVDIQKTLYNSISYNTLMTLLRMFSKYKMTELQEYILNSARSAHNLEIINFHKNNIVKKIAKALFSPLDNILNTLLKTNKKIFEESKDSPLEQETTALNEALKNMVLGTEYPRKNTIAQLYEKYVLKKKPKYGFRF